MAIIYGLWAECRDETGLDRLKAHFDGLKHTLLNGRAIEFTANIERPYGEMSGLFVWSKQLSPNGVRNLNDALETTAAGIFLYHRLKSAPDFRFARVDWEPEIITTAELSDFFETAPDGKTRTGLSCVLDTELYNRLGSPVLFEKFRAGYWWQKFRGESYEPLFSNDQEALNELCRRLLPENFL